MPAGPHWRAWAVALLTALALLGGLETLWRRRGYRPCVVDDKQLWCTQRARLSAMDGNSIALLGSSRCQVDVIPGILSDVLGNAPVAQLAIDGHAPMAALEDIAERTDYGGLVVCAVTPWGLLPELWDMQQGHVSYFRTQWQPFTRVSRRLKTSIQEHVLVVNPHVSMQRVLPPLCRGEPVAAQFLFTHRDRWREARYDRVPDLPEYERGLLEHTERQFAALTAGDSAGDAWHRLIDRANAAVAAIQARGGRVVFLRFVSTGAMRQLEERHFPRGQYWNVFAERIQTVAVHFEDVPEMSGFVCPEGSHLDAADAPRFTRALAQLLSARGLVGGQ